MAFCLMTWCIRKRGPLYVSVFSPLLLIIVAILSWILFEESLYIGTFVGSVLIVVGLYGVLWGKNREIEVIVHNIEDQDEEGTTANGFEITRRNGEITAPNGMEVTESNGMEITVI
ncbi:unnamed protein product [Fraxinus pennsylvanica]|uniref:WAT1-related protein n=1 Tax=Fraxinus pennsylvanica TaxID=56036 RepID=A0AAD1ZFL3_9LAMI|nr:unnamed protein product [Fraxinus pennsylvanica]